ncbi:MAG: HesB/IscA family protein, partial [Candidatus Binatia bacterium]
MEMTNPDRNLDLKLTESAIEQVKKLLARDDRAGQSLRVGVTDGGCSGHSYKLDFDREQKAGDT